MNNTSIEQLVSFDKKHVWHPYASITSPLPVYPVASANGAKLRLVDGTELIDGMSSWWSVIHGYNHPVLNSAIESQLKNMAHVMFAGLTHKPAVELASLIAEITPHGLEKVFFCDSGSVAVEIAIKMAIQYWYAAGKPEKNRLVSLKSGYHGDTFMAMSVCDPAGMHQIFDRVIQKQFYADAPATRYDEKWDENDIKGMEEILHDHHQEIAAIILEPVLQGAGGMRNYSPQYVKRVRELSRKYNVLLIADEIATGFGRTGSLFACEKANVCPDIMCIGKAITGGYISLSAVIATKEVAETISSGKEGAFMHGPTFMANPLACAVAVASIKLLLSMPWKRRVAEIETRLMNGLKECANDPAVADVRALGAIGVIEMKKPVDLSSFQKRVIKTGVWLRPFGNVIYTMPPYIIQDQEIDIITGAMKRLIKE
ncbi:MAG: adenosylmethionine--8-amino-7-oxononanoate transaminase [Deltaproteobacteria bacterium]|nr:adenosylmethionine--8-amino-7-oxononanoate transaminase [Deltaproteobacteria bacterium]